MRSLLLSLFVGGLAFLPRGAFGQNLVSRSQLRRTVDPSERSATGEIILTVDNNGKQTMQANVGGLGLEAFALFQAPYATFVTNCCTDGIAPLNQLNVAKGTWSRLVTGTNAPPPELINLGYANLSDLDGTRADIAGPASVLSEIVTSTNIVGNTTNLVMGIPVPTPVVTNIVQTVLWAPLYAPSADPSSRSYLRKGTLSLPDVPPGPGAKATVTVRFNGSSGESIFDVRATHLERGQVYQVWIADTTNQTSYVLIDAGTMTSISSSARYLRDTKFGDPLPQQVRDAGDLSGHIIEIRDQFDFVYLTGLVP
jgi:hypothetical protein